MAQQQLTSRNTNAFPSSAAGAKAMKLAISFSEGIMIGRLAHPVERSKMQDVGNCLGVLASVRLLIEVVDLRDLCCATYPRMTMTRG